MAIAPNNLFGACAIVGQEENDRVVERLERAKLIEHATNLVIHAIDHRGMHRHLGGLKLLLLGRQFVPLHGVGHFTGADALQQGGLGQVPCGHRVRLQRRQRGIQDAHLFHAFPTALAQRVPTGAVGIAIFGDVFRQRLYWKVGDGERKVVKKRPVGKCRGVLFETLDRVIGDRNGRIETGTGFDRRQLHVVLKVDARGKVTVLVVQPVGVVEPVLQRFPVEVPLARMICAVTERPEEVRQQARPTLSHAGGAAAQAGQRVAVNLLRVIAGQQRRARRPATRGIVKLREAQAAFRQRVEIGRMNLATVATEIRVTEVVGQDEQDVRSPRSFGGGTHRSDDGEQTHGKEGGETMVHSVVGLWAKSVDQSLRTLRKRQSSNFIPNARPEQADRAKVKSLVRHSI